MDKTAPKHRSIYIALRHDILSGKYEDAGRFPSEGMLMRRFGVSRITVRQALTELKNEGFLEARSGSGTYLSALARHAAGMIGLVIPDYSSNRFFRRLGDALVEAGKAAGYTMLLGSLPGDTPAARAHEAIALAEEYARRKVAGVIIEPVELMPNSADLTREIVAAFDALLIPVILVDRDISTTERSGYDLVGIDNLGAGLLLGRHLIAGGARRIAFLMPPHSGSANLTRMLGVAGAVVEAGLDWSNRNILFVDPDDAKALAKTLSARPKPDVVVCHNDQTAAKLPRSVKVAGFDGLDTGDEHPFPSVCQPIPRIAETAIASLLERIRHPGTPPRQILLACDGCFSSRPA
jgi:DNA-binding LacI/PurR family transcriptional regulator